ncbi:MAG: flagellar biosynthesis protein FlhA [Candidatus Hydrogenedentes bacterium]|nr:flagellar biosynthesis protein FlhA [Candidatus Hydrogenedentota bacterium]
MASATETTLGSLRQFSLTRNQDIALAVAVIGILAVLVIPMPTWTLDLLLTLNISVSVVVLLAAIYLQRPVEFAVFPSLLLILTLFRLGLNVASTRLILSQANAGKVIQSFGNFVTAGNIFVGIVIFSILVIIQFVVITRGATRISEVAARFTLDAMPGKQMGVDSDLNAGLITEEQARERRRAIEREADFYGAMDGATKFVRGDAVAGLIITIVNIVFGLIIGVLSLGLPLTEAAGIYTRLTIGDGLVSQIPSLIISVASGLVVTRTVSEENLGRDIGYQLTRYPRALAVAAAMLFAFGLAPGMPTIPFFMVGSIFGYMAYQSSRQQEAREALAAAEAAARQETAPAPTATVDDLLTVDPLKIELGYGLIVLADPNQGGDLLTRIQIIRQQIASRMGFVVPVIRIVDNLRLRPNEYQIKLRESVIGRYEVQPDCYLAMNPGTAEESIEGLPTTEPAFGLQAVWISRDRRDLAEQFGYTLVEPSAVIATHLTELIYTHADELLTREDVQSLVARLRERAPTVVNELLPNLLNYGELQKVLQNLLRERVSIRNLETILETLCDFASRTKDPEILTEYVRHALAREISAQYADENGNLNVITVSPQLEQEILNAVNSAATAMYIPVSPARAMEIADATARALQPLVGAGLEPVVVTSAPARRYFRRIVERHIPKIVVLSFNEIDPAFNVESMGQVEVPATRGDRS